MFATFPVKPTKPKPKEFKSPPKILKREHRVARVFEPQSPDLPTRPRSARTQERPAPIISLPGLPAYTFPGSIGNRDRPKGLAGGVSGVLDSGRSWLAQIRPPWAKKTVLKIPPTPKTAKFVNEDGLGYGTPKSAKFGGEESDDDDDDDDTLRRDPPPLYTKHAPEGGLAGWITVGAAFLIQFCTIGFLFTWNVFEDHYAHQFLTDQNPIAIRFIGSVQWFLAFFLALVGGKLADMGFFRFVVLGGSVLFASSLFLLSLAAEEAFGVVFVCQAIGMGAGIGLVFVPTATVVVHYFKRQRGFAIGIVMSGGSFGGMIWPAALRGLIPKHGLETSVRIVAAIILVFLAIGNGLFFFKQPPKEEKPAYPVPRLDLAKYTKELEYIFAAGATFLAMLFIFYPVWYLELLGLERGVDPKSAFTSVIILSFTAIVGRVALGFASDMVGVWNLLMPISGLLALMMFTMCSVQGIKSFVGVAFFYGIFSGAWLSLMVTALASLASRTGEVGTRVGLVLSIASFGQLFSAVIQYAMLTPNFTWLIPSVICGIIFSVVTALAVLSRMKRSLKTPYRTRKYIYKVQVL